MSTAQSKSQATTLDNNRAHDEGLGEKLRLRRKVKRLSLQSVADASGISIGQLSQIERGISAPSLRSLRQICQALEMPIGWLFDSGEELDPEEAGMIVRASGRRDIILDSSKMVKELLTPDASTQIQMMRILIQPGGASGDEPYQTKGGARCATVLEGALGLEVDGRRFLLNRGDSFAFEAQHALRFWCEGEKPCELVWAITPAIY